MRHFLGRRCFNRTLLSLVLTSFTITYCVPLKAYECGVINDAILMVRLEKLVEKLVKSENKGTDKIIERLVDIKNEIENSYGISLNIDDYMQKVSKEIKKKGNHSAKSELEIIRKKIKAQDKKQNHHALYVSEFMNVEGYQLNAIDEEMMYIAKNEDEKDKKEEKKELEVPALLVYGVTCTLCGFFLSALKIPICQEWGPKLMVMGITACANSLCNKAEEEKRSQEFEKNNPKNKK